MSTHSVMKSRFAEWISRGKAVGIPEMQANRLQGEWTLSARFQCVVGRQFSECTAAVLSVKGRDPK